MTRQRGPREWRSLKHTRRKAALERLFLSKACGSLSSGEISWCFVEYEVLFETRRWLVAQRQYGETEGEQNTNPEKKQLVIVYSEVRLVICCGSSLPGSSLGLSKGCAQGALAASQRWRRKSWSHRLMLWTWAERTHWGIQSPQWDVSRWAMPSCALELSTEKWQALHTQTATPRTHVTERGSC